MIPLILTALVLCPAIFSTGQAPATSEFPAELRQQIIDVGMAPWNGRTASLDEALRDPNREKVSLCGSGSWGGQRPSMGDYVTGPGAPRGATAAGGG